MKFEHTRVFNIEGALRGMRNPKESWDRSDSMDCWEDVYNSSCCWCDEPAYTGMNCDGVDEAGNYIAIGPNDMKLAQKLIRAGSEHRKFMRQIMVCVDITAPLYWWKEFDTYKVGTVANSTSTMHTIQNKPITKELFEIGDYHPELDLIDDTNLSVRVDCFLNDLEQLRQKFIETNDKRYWKELIRWLPSGWLQTRTVTMNYENLLNMCSKSQRRFHKQTEWSRDFINWARSLPYAQELIFIDEIPQETSREQLTSKMKLIATDLKLTREELEELEKIVFGEVT